MTAIHALLDTETIIGVGEDGAMPDHRRVRSDRMNMLTMPVRVTRPMAAGAGLGVGAVLTLAAVSLAPAVAGGREPALELAPTGITCPSPGSCVVRAEAVASGAVISSFRWRRTGPSRVAMTVRVKITDTASESR